MSMHPTEELHTKQIYACIELDRREKDPARFLRALHSAGWREASTFSVRVSNGKPRLKNPF